MRSSSGAATHFDLKLWRKAGKNLRNFAALLRYFSDILVHNRPCTCAFASVSQMSDRQNQLARLDRKDTEITRVLVMMKDLSVQIIYITEKPKRKGSACKKSYAI